MKNTNLPKYLGNIYINNNCELSNYSFDTIKKHYIFFGNKENRCIFLKNAFEKMNGIDGICWINLDRSIERKNYMNFILQYSKIPTYRIEAIDGKKNLDEYLIMENKYKNNNMTNYEIACTLSHLKALDYIKKLNGQYFVICEDDISLENIKYFKNTDLKKIIEEAPDFDILMISHTSNEYIKNKYISWNDEYKKNNHIAGTVCYIANKINIYNSTNNIISIYNEKNYLNNFIKNADMFIYDNFKTIVYKYNFISCINIDSEIHSHHLPHHIETQNNNLQKISKNKTL